MNHSVLGAACAGILITINSTAQAVAISGQGTWETTLLGRDLDGDLSTIEAYYDTALDITWMADVSPLGYGMDWDTANALAAGLDPYGSGITGWRLPTVTDTGTLGCDGAYGGTDCGYNVDTATGELAHMFFDTLGNLSYFDTSGTFQPGYGLSNTGPFSNIFSGYYWSATEYAPTPTIAWMFSTNGGFQSLLNKTDGAFTWAVHAGDVGTPTTVPLPAAAWLFGSGLLGLVGVSRTRRAEPAGHSRPENSSQPCMRRTHANVKHILLASLRRSPKPAQRLLTCSSAVTR